LEIKGELPAECLAHAYDGLASALAARRYFINTCGDNGSWTLASSLMDYVNSIVSQQETAPRANSIFLPTGQGARCTDRVKKWEKL